MNLMLHQFRKDVRQFRWLLLVWLLMLVSDFAVNLGWIGAGIGANWRQGDMTVVNVMVGVQTFFLWVLFFLIPSAVVLADSPARRDGFLRTRPLPASDLYLAKSLFLVVLVICPVLVQEGIYLAASGLPSGYVVHGVLERLLYALPMVVIAAGYAALWRSYAQWSTGFGIALAGMICAGMTLELVFYLGGLSDRLPGASSATETSRSVGALYVFALVSVLVAVGHARWVWRARGRWLGIAAALAAYSLVNIYWPWDLFRAGGADPAAARQLAAEFPPNFSRSDIEINPVFASQWDSREHLGVNVKSTTVPADFPSVIDWLPSQCSLTDPAGAVVKADSVPSYSSSYSAYLWGQNGPSGADLKMWVHLLPPEVIFQLGPTYSMADNGSSFGEFKLDPQSPWLNGPVNLQAHLDGRVYRWDKVADFALNTPGTVRDASGSWSYEGLHYDRNSAQEADVFLKRSQVSLATAADTRLTAFGYTPTERFSFVFYNQRLNLAQEAGRWPAVVTTRARATGLSQYWLDLNENQSMGIWHAFTPAEFAECHLLIFQKTWLGTAPADWKSAEFAVDDVMMPPATGQSAGENGLAPGEVERRIAELPVPDAKASRLEVCHYLVQALPILDAGRYGRPPGEAVVNRLAGLVPDHLEILLDGLPAMGPASKPAVLDAIGRGAEESQKDVIIAALAKHPELMRVILRRDWVMDARNAIYQLMDSPRPLSFEAIQALASFQDPQTYPHLLEALKAQPRSDVYDILRVLPGMAAPLADCVSTIWRESNGIVSYNSGEFVEPILGLALHAGNPEALRFAYRLLEESGSNRFNSGDWALAQVFRENVKPDKLGYQDVQDNTKLLRWMSGYQADSFVFDPVRRRFVLKPGVQPHPPSGRNR